MPWPGTSFAERVGLRYPIVQAPMSGITPPALVAAVSNAGALGSLGAAFLGPDDLRDAIRAIRRITDRPFNVNLFVWRDPQEPTPDHVKAVDAALLPYRSSLGLPAGVVAPVPASPQELLVRQLKVVCDERVPAVSFTFGIPPLEDLQRSGALLIGTATTVAEAVAIEEAGADAVVAQGFEAGGHRGTFLAPVDRSMVGTFALVPQMVDRVAVPVIASGGIMDGRGVAAALVLGAQAAQLGTAFLACPESGAHPTHKAALPTIAETATTVTAAYSGKAARAVRTELIEDLEAKLPEPLEFPLQLARTVPIHLAAAQHQRPDLMLLLAGQAARLCRNLPAAQLVASLAAETEAVLRAAGGRTCPT